MSAIGLRKRPSLLSLPLLLLIQSDHKRRHLLGLVATLHRRYPTNSSVGAPFFTPDREVTLRYKRAFCTAALQYYLNLVVYDALRY